MSESEPLSHDPSLHPHGPCDTCKALGIGYYAEAIVGFEDEWLQRGFTQFWNVVLLNGRLSVGARVLWATLAHYARQDNDAWPGQARLAVSLGSSERSVRSWLRELEDIGLVGTTRRFKRTNVYRLKSPDAAYMADLDRQSNAANIAALSAADIAGTSAADIADQKKTQVIEEEAVEEEVATGVASDDGHLPGLAPPPSPSSPPEPRDPFVEELWTFYVGIFGDALGVKELTAPRRKHLKKALTAVANNVEVCKRAVLGLQEYRKQKPGKTGLDVIFSTGPQDRSNLTEKIEWWASQAPDEGRPEVPASVPSHARSRVLELVASVLKPERMELTDSQKERCAESAMILQRQFGLRVRSDGSGKWLGLEEVPKGEA